MIRPRRTLDYLTGEAEGLPPELNPFSKRPPRVIAPPTPGPVVIDAPAPEYRVDEPPLGAPPVMPDLLTRDRARLRELQTTPVERSRLKSAGTGFLRGGIPGLLTGIATPELHGELKRNKEIGQIEKRIGTDIAMRQAGQADRLRESQILENEAQAEARRRPPRPILGRETMPDGTTIQTQLNPETGQFEPAQGQDGPIVLSRPKAPPRMVDMTLSDGRVVQVPEVVALTADATRENRLEGRETRAAERESQAIAAQTEFDSLVEAEKAAEKTKNDAYAYLAQLKANPNVSEDDIREATRAAESANSLYQSFGVKKSAVKGKVAQFSRPPRPSPYAGKVLSRSAADAWAAKQIASGKFKSVAEAMQALAEAQVAVQ